MKNIIVRITLSAFCLFFTLKSNAQNGTKQFEFDDFFKNYTFYSPGIRSLKSMKDGENYAASEGRGTKIAIHSYETGETVKTILDLSQLKNDSLKNFSDFSFDASETKILLLTDKESIYRRSFTAKYFVYDIEKQTITKVSENGKQQLATFSPDGSKVAFVRLNNLFYTDLQNGKETQITMDGKFNFVINGVPDWVYEEEFEFNKAFEWSPDGKYIAWVRFDESLVPQFSMTMFQGMEPSLDENSLYPGVTTFKYPKAGDPNSVVSVHSYNIASGQKLSMDIGTETDNYIPRIRFTQDPNQLAIFRLNRLQNKLEILLATLSTGKTTTLLTETNKYFLDENYFDDVKFLDDKLHFTLRSERDGFAHIYLYDMQGKMVSQVTKGNFDVTAMNGIDVKNKLVYYTSAEPKPYQREVYCVKWDGSGKRKLSVSTGTNSIKFSEGFKYYTLTFSTAKTPSTTMLYNEKGKTVRVLDDNNTLNTKLKDYTFSYREFLDFNTSGNVNLNGWMLKPADFDLTKKYPVFMTQYSGPGSQSALDAWDLGWEEYLSQLGYIVVCVDGRGTGGRGEAFRKVTYLQLGKFETIDQIETAKYLGTLPFVDANRIGIWGWSFGGYISSSCMVKGDGVFKTGIAVAPVTNWRYYDNIYTERFMRTPQENPEGYDQNSPLNFAENLKGNFLVCHGTADDNVHAQNTYEFTERLVQANKQFEMQLYTNRNHGIYGGNTTYHLYTRMINYILEKL
ncbi:MAG: S9 family peptidase [Bacteroidales bacterium]